jgi:hypothetical protein
MAQVPSDRGCETRKKAGAQFKTPVPSQYRPVLAKGQQEALRAATARVAEIDYSGSRPMWDND